MIVRWILLTLLAFFAVLVVTFAVLMAGYGIAEAAGDTAGARAVWWIAMSCLVMLAVDSVLLLGLLGWRELDRSFSERHELPGEDDRPSHRGEQ